MRGVQRAQLRNPENASWFTTSAVYNIAFEIISACGTVGLSVGILTTASRKLINTTTRRVLSQKKRDWIRGGNLSNKHDHTSCTTSSSVS
ncbi:hypothetical protein EDB86DRAFT_2972195, partial [Lactarius hatsudake]